MDRGRTCVRSALTNRYWSVRQHIAGFRKLYVSRADAWSDVRRASHALEHQRWLFDCCPVPTDCSGHGSACTFTSATENATS